MSLLLRRGYITLKRKYTFDLKKNLYYIVEFTPQRLFP